jgi:hypothetical protein
MLSGPLYWAESITGTAKSKAGIKRIRVENGGASYVLAGWVDAFELVYPPLIGDK